MRHAPRLINLKRNSTLISNPELPSIFAPLPSKEPLSNTNNVYNSNIIISD